MREENPHHIVPRVVHLEGELEQLQRLIRGGDGKSMGLGPLVFQHDKKLEEHDRNFGSIQKQVRALQDRDIKITAYVTGAVGVVVFLIQLFFKLWK